MAERNDGAPNGPRWGRVTRTASFWALLVVISILLVQLTGTQKQSREIVYSQFTRQLAANNIDTVVVIAGQKVQGTFRPEVQGPKGAATRNFTMVLPVRDYE